VQPVNYSEKCGLAIMQPYLFPYVGYFQLIESTSKIIFYDDVQYIIKGWINRNNLLLNGSAFLFTVPVEKVSRNKLIFEVKPLIDNKFHKKFFAQIDSAYKKAPQYSKVKEVLHNVFDKKHENIADLAIASVVAVYDYLGVDFDWDKSSNCSPNTKGLDKAERLIKITKEQGFDKYVNAINGKDLYDKDFFKKNGVQLDFIKPNFQSYKQFDNEFIPSLSIIDILMFNDIKAIREQISNYTLV